LWVAKIIENESSVIYTYVRIHPSFIPLLLLGLGVLGFIMSKLFIFVPEVKGSGLPYVKSVLKGILSFKWLKVFLATIISSFMTFFAGVPLGSEGPSIQLGSAIGQAVNNGSRKIEKNYSAWRRFSMTGGAASGLAIAFNAPLGGICFALEETHKKLTPLLFITSAISVLFSILTQRAISAWTNIELFTINFGTIESIPLHYEWMFVVLGVIVGIMASLISILMLKANSFIDKIKLNTSWKIVITFILVGICGIINSNFIGTGENFVENNNFLNLTWYFLLVILAVRLFLILLASSNNVTGGMLIPILAMGAIISAIVGKLFILMGMNEQYLNLFVIVGMFSFMGSVMRAPLTAIVMSIELVQASFGGFLTASITIASAYLIIQFLGIPIFYDFTIGKLMNENDIGKKNKFYSFKVIAEEGSFAVGKEIRDILWPNKCVVLAYNQNLQAGESNYILDTSKKIEAGDEYIIQVETNDIDIAKIEIDDLVKKK